MIGRTPSLTMREDAMEVDKEDENEEGEEGEEGDKSTELVQTPSQDLFELIDSLGELKTGMGKVKQGKDVDEHVGDPLRASYAKSKTLEV